MLSFQEYLLEVAHTNIFDPTQKYEHSTHASSLHVLGGKQGAEHFVRMTNEITNSINNQNTVPDHVRTKFDGAPAIFASQEHIAKKGKKVASSHSEIRSVWDRSSQGLRDVMHSAMKHIKPLVPKNVTVMGDVMHMGGTTRRESGRKRVVEPARQVQQGSFRPNLLHYHHTTPEGRVRAEQSHMGFVPHTVIEGQNTRPITRQEFNSINEKGKERGVDVISPFIDHKVSFTDHEKKQLDHHLSNYVKAHNAHDYSKTDHHSDMFEQYLNSGIWENKKHSVENYRDFLQKKATTHKDKKVREQASKNLSTLEHDSTHLENSLNMFHHSRSIAKIINDAVSRNHPIKTTHEGQSMPHEGVVSSMPVQGMKGHGPVIKFVDRRSAAEGGFSGLNKAVGQMSKTSTVNESVEKPVHAFYGKVQYATIGHKTAIDQMKDAAKKEGASTAIGLSNTPGPLGVKGKKEHAESIFNHPVDTGEEHTKDFLKFVTHLHKQGHTHLTIHAGSDRAGDYQKILDRYNGKPTKTGEVLFNFKSAKVRQVGSDRDEGELTKDPRKMNRDELVRTAKASRLRGYAKEGTEDAKQKFFAYHKPLGLPTSTVGKHWENLKSAVKGLKEETDETVKNASRQYMELRKKQKKGELNPFDAAKIAAMKKLVTQKEETECPPGIKKIRYKGTLGRKDMMVCPRRSGSSAGGNGGNGN